MYAYNIQRASAEIRDKQLTFKCHLSYYSPYKHNKTVGETLFSFNGLPHFVKCSLVMQNNGVMYWVILGFS